MDAVISGVLPMPNPASIERHYSPSHIWDDVTSGQRGGNTVVLISARWRRPGRRSAGFGGIEVGGPPPISGEEALMDGG